MRLASEEAGVDQPLEFALDRALAGLNLARDLTHVEGFVRAGIAQPQDRAPRLPEQRTPKIGRDRPCAHNECDSTQNGYSTARPILCPNRLPLCAWRLAPHNAFSG